LCDSSKRVTSEFYVIIFILIYGETVSGLMIQCHAKMPKPRWLALMDKDVKARAKLEEGPF